MNLAAAQRPAVSDGKNKFALHVFAPGRHGLHHPAGIVDEAHGAVCEREQQLSVLLHDGVGLFGLVAGVEQIVHFAHQFRFAVAPFQFVHGGGQFVIGVLQVLLCNFSGGDVGTDAQDAHHGPVAVRHRDFVHFQPDLFSAGPFLQNFEIKDGNTGLDDIAVVGLYTGGLCFPGK